jgi:thiol-disulfide isomerase/thioredoxin
MPAASATDRGNVRTIDEQEHRPSRKTFGGLIMLRPILLPAAMALFLAVQSNTMAAPYADAGKEPLSIGDPAPKLETQEFVKGQPVKGFERGKIYVVEFWATWCAPCRESIPHLTKLQKENKEVAFIGVSIDDETAAVKPFVDKMGDKMDYRVAIDAHDGDSGRMAQSWLAASGQEGIPAAFIVSGDGRIAWIGHPGDIEEPLAQIIAGKWDLVAKAAEYKKAMAQARATAQLQAQLGLLLKTKKFTEALNVLDNASKKIELNDELTLMQLSLVAGPENNSARALAIAKPLVEKAAKEEDAATLLMIATALVDPQTMLALPTGAGKPQPAAKIDPKLAELAVKAAEAGERLAHSGNPIEDAQAAMLLAKAYRASGENDKAIAKLDDSAKAIGELIESANSTTHEIRDVKASLSGAGGGASSEKVTEKPMTEKPKIGEK